MKIRMSSFVLFAFSALCFVLQSWTAFTPSKASLTKVSLRPAVGDTTPIMVADNTFVGIYVDTPQYRLDVNGLSKGNPIRLKGLLPGSPTDSLISSQNGVLRRISVDAIGGGQNWSRLGNVGTNPATNFVGTTDTMALSLRTNAVERLRLSDQSALFTVPLTKDNATFYSFKKQDFYSPNYTTGILIDTDVPFNYQMMSMRVRGYAYGDGTYLDVKVQFYTYGNSIINTSVLNNGSTDPGVITIMRNPSGLISLHMSKIYYYQSLEIDLDRGTNRGAYTPNAANWTISNAAYNTSSTLIQAVPVKGSLQTWNTNGNAGTNPATNFIGTNDAQALSVKTNNVERLRLETNGDATLNNQKFYNNGAIYNTQNNDALTQTLKDVFYHFIPTSGQTGAYVIQCPFGWNDGFHSYKIKGYNYTSNATWELSIAFHNYSGGYFAGYRGHLTGNAPFSEAKLAIANGKVQIILGTVTSSWAYPIIAVTEGIVRGGAANYATGWQGGLQTSLTAYTNVTNVNINQSGGTYTDDNESYINLNTTGQPTYNATMRSRYDGAEPFYLASQNIKILGVKTLGVPSGASTYMNGYYNLAFLTGSTATPTSSDMKMLIDNTGNVGIGTTTPTSKLNVYTPTNCRTCYTDAATLTGGQDSSYNGFGIGMLFNGKNYTNTVKNFARIGTELNDNSVENFGANLFFEVAPTNSGLLQKAMTLRYNGNLGIGTRTPTAKLHVAGNVKIDDLPIGTSTDSVLVSNNGLVKKVGQNSIGGGAAWSLLGNTGTNVSNNYIGTSDNIGLAVRTNGAERMRVTETGNVGIGTTNPNAKFQVLGSAYFGNSGDQAVSIGNSRRLNYADVLIGKNVRGLDGTDQYVAVATSSATGYSAIEFRYSGDAGIMGNSGATTQDGVITPNFLQFWKSNGNVGIGTTSPQTKLDVTGIVQAPSYNVVNGNFIFYQNANRNIFQSYGGQPFDWTIGSNNLMTLDNSGLTIKTLATGSSTDSVLVSNNGLVKKIAQSSIGGGTAWSLTGNAGTSPATNFVGTKDAQDLLFKTNNTERLRVFTNGSVGINTSTLNSNGILQVNGDVGLSGTDAKIRSASNTDNDKLSIFFNKGVISEYNSTANTSTRADLFSVTSNNDGRLLAYFGKISTNSGLLLKNEIFSHTSLNLMKDSVSLLYANTYSDKVGIGTSSPTQKLDVVGAGKFTVSSGANLILQKPSGAGLSFTDGTNENGLIQAGAASSNHMQFCTNTATNTGIVERMRITNTGNVGIGTSTPQVKLHVSGGNLWVNRPTIKLDNGAVNELSGGLDFNSSLFSAGQANYATYRWVDATTFRMGVDYDGNSGLGGTFANLQLGTRLIPYLHIQNSGATAGNIGIGTVLPTAKLHVSGTVKMEGLPTGAGTVLVVDANGNVMKQGVPLTGNTNESNSGNNNEIIELRKMLMELKGEVARLKASLEASSAPRSGGN